MKTYKTLLTIIALAFITGCTERIDVDLRESYDRIVVEGYITNEPGLHSIELSKNTGYFNPGKAERISNALVTLNDGVNGTDTLKENPENPGVYQTNPNFAGVPGREYRLRIELDEPIHETTTYTASSVMPPGRTLDSINIHYIGRWEAWEVRAYATDPPTKDYYMFDLYKNGQLLTDTIDEPFVIDDRLFNGQSTNGAAIGYFQAEYPEEILKEGDKITARMGRITEAHYHFMLDVSTETGFQNPLFSGPPANIRSNISDGGIGFFGAFTVDYASTVYTRDEEK